MKLPDNDELMQAVEDFDQLGEQQDNDATTDDARASEVGGNMGNAYMMLVEQQLDTIEGDPAELLHNRFKLEERRRQQSQNPGGRIYEPRPW
jgi:hypothetical protein